MKTQWFQKKSIFPPYWGPIKETPGDRKLRENHNCTVSADSDVSEIWWPELLEWLKNNYET